MMKDHQVPMALFGTIRRIEEKNLVMDTRDLTQGGEGKIFCQQLLIFQTSFKLLHHS